MTLTFTQTDTQSAPATLFCRKFTVHSRLLLRLEDERLKYSLVPVEPPYEKDIPSEDADYGFDEIEPIVILAAEEGKPAGRIRMVSWWNQFAYVDDIVVNPEFRGRGIGRALLERGIQWSREKGFPGVMLETQQDNPRACALYASCGFVLSGYDSGVYKALKRDQPETALYWYLIF